jgi:hypothetical protein
MEPRGWNRWQSLAGRPPAKNRQNERNPLPLAATHCLRHSMVRRGRRFESVRGLHERPASGPFCCLDRVRASLEGPSTCPQDLSPACRSPGRLGLKEGVCPHRAPPWQGGARRKPSTASRTETARCRGCAVGLTLPSPADQPSAVIRRLLRPWGERPHPAGAFHPRGPGSCCGELPIDGRGFRDAADVLGG